MNADLAKLRNNVLAEIKRLTQRDGGQVPGQRAFQMETGISIGSWKGRFWSNWSEAVSEAGFSPNQAPAKKDDTEIIEILAEAVRHFEHFPSLAKLSVFLHARPGAPSLRTIKDRYPQKNDMIVALFEHARIDAAYFKLTQFLSMPPSATSDSHKRNAEGFVYLLKSGSHFKIGRSETLERRIKEIVSLCPRQSRWSMQSVLTIRLELKRIGIVVFQIDGRTENGSP